jgi:DNA-binding transcriptional LysR family regulator
MYRHGVGVMELRQIRYFLAIAHHRHFTRAAEEVFVAQPALSQQIKSLERELGVMLFDRSGHRVRLTEAGEAFHLWAERIAADAESAQAEMHEFAGLAQGRVVVGTIPAQMLGPVNLPTLLAEFHGRYPGIAIALREEFPDELIRSIRSGEIDLAFGAEMDTGPAADIASRPIFADELVLIAGPGHAPSERRRVHLADLADETFVSFKRGSLIRDLVSDRCAAVGFTPRVLFESNEVGTVRALVSRGLGVAVLPRSVVDTPGDPVSVLLIDDLRAIRTIMLLWSASRYQSAAAGAFLAFVQERLGSGQGNVEESDRER